VALAVVTVALVRVTTGFLDFKDQRNAVARQDGRGHWVGADHKLCDHLLKAQHIKNEPRFGSGNETDALGIGWSDELSKRAAL
jgi:hypothetical protein